MKNYDLATNKNSVEEKLIFLSKHVRQNWIFYHKVKIFGLAEISCNFF